MQTTESNMTPRQIIRDIAFEDFQNLPFTATVLACLAEAIDCLAKDDPARESIVAMIVRAKESRRRA
jgi:hypothetical protein